MSGTAPFLVVFAGLPGVGKTSVARALALASGAVYLRVDTVEQALRRAGGEVGTAGYGVVQALAAENLGLGRDVLVDGVNPLAESREAFAARARENGARLIDVEVVCSNVVEHRRRVEARTSDIPGHALPAWADVIARGYEPWATPRIVIDTEPSKRRSRPWRRNLLEQMDPGLKSETGLSRRGFRATRISIPKPDRPT